MARSFNRYILATARVDVLTDPDNPTTTVGGVETNNGSFASVASVANPGQVRFTMDAERRFGPKAVIKITCEGAVSAESRVVRAAAPNDGLNFDVFFLSNAGAAVNADFNVEISDEYNG